MNNNSDPLFKQYADMDFAEAKPVAEVPALDKLQAAHGGKSRITMCEDNATLAVFNARAESGAGRAEEGLALLAKAAGKYKTKP